MRDRADLHYLDGVLPLTVKEAETQAWKDYMEAIAEFDKVYEETSK